MQAWLSTNSLNHNYTSVQLHLLSGLSFAYNDLEPSNDTKSDRPLCEHCKLWTEKQDCIPWDNCHGTEGVILINGSYGIVWDCPLRGMQSLIALIKISPAILTKGCVQFSSVQFSSVTQSCLTLCDPMNHSTPGLPVHHKLPEFTQTHVHRVSDAIQPSHPLSSPSPPALNPSQHQDLFQ